MKDDNSRSNLPIGSKEDPGSVQAGSDLNHQREFYNERWAEVRFANRLKMIRCAAILEAISELRLSDPRIVELGCGTGWMTSILGVFGPATGVDFSEAAIESASTSYPSSDFACADIQSWGLDEGFDIAVSHEVIEHLQDQALHLVRIHDLLDESGFLVLTTPNRSTFLSMPEKQRSTWSQQPIENWMSQRELRTLIQESGFQVMKLGTLISGYGRSPLRRLAGSRRIRSGMKAIGLYGAYERLCCWAGLGLHIICVARKGTL